MTFSVDSPGKINLTLEILARRPDGFHELRSVLMPVSLFDTITVRDRADGEITCATVGEGVDVAELSTLPAARQLAVRAANLVRRVAGVTRGCDIFIRKRIPIGAGMAGGSADAAGTIRALCGLWKLDVPAHVWLDAAAEIGSDIPALLLGGAVLMEGRGEKVSPILTEDFARPAPFWLVAVFPGFPVSTKRVYENCKPCLTNRAKICENVISSVRTGDVRAACSGLHNGLQDTVYRLHPETERFCTALREGGALSALLSGSGSAVFGLAESREHALAIQRCLPKNVWSKVISTLPDGVMAAHGPLVP